MGIQGMVTRTGWDSTTWGANQRITVDEALKVNTLNGAYASHEESIKGSITRGQARRLRRAGGRSAHRRSDEDQGHSDRADGGRGDVGL